MQRRITEAHLILIVTFVLYMGYQWLMQWIPIKNVIFHMLMGQVMLVLPGGIMDADTISKEADRNCQKECFLCRYPMPTSKWLWHSDYFCLSGCGDFESFFYVFVKKSGDGSHAVYDETGIFSNAVCDGSDAGIE